MDIRYFMLAEWVERDLVILERIHTSINLADHMTKILDRTLFYRHVDYIMGHIPPKYSPYYALHSKQPNMMMDTEWSIEDMDRKKEAATAAKCHIASYQWSCILAFT